MAGGKLRGRGSVHGWNQHEAGGRETSQEAVVKSQAGEARPGGACGWEHEERERRVKTSGGKSTGLGGDWI